MLVYQIAGLPGTGKTTIQHELEKLGYDTINTDDAWGHYGHIPTESPVEKPADATREWFTEHGYIWSSAQVRPLLSAERKRPLFICGGSRNESRFYDLLDKRFVLYAPNNVMRERLIARHDPNSSSELFITRMQEYNSHALDDAKKHDSILIDTIYPLKDCLKIILDIINANN